MHYAHAVFLLQEQPDKAIEEFKRELELQPEHAWSLMQIAYEYVNRGDAKAACRSRTGGRRGADLVRGAKGARTGAPRHRGHRRRHQGAALGIKLAPESPRPPLHDRPGVSARRAYRRRHTGTRRVHQTRSPGADAAQRRPIGGRQHRAAAVATTAIDIREEAGCSPPARASRRLAVIAVMLAPAGHARQTPQRAEGAVQAGVRAVLVDVVIRDRRGQPVRDLTESDFEVLEDGVPQTLGSFSRVFELPAGAPPAPTTAATPAAAAGGAPTLTNAPAITASSGPGVMALVFDRLSPEARRLAAQSARNYIGSKEESPDFIGVFGIDLSLASYVPFTRNAVALRRALDSMVKGGSLGFTSAEQQQALTSAQQQAAAAQQAANAAIANAGGPGGGTPGGAPADAKMMEMQSETLRDFELMQRDQQGYATTNGLFAIVRTLGRIPGRKSLVLFSEGIAIPDAVQRLYLGVIDAANRANVSIYTMDAAGLRAESDLAKMRDAVNLAGAVGITSGYPARRWAALVHVCSKATKTRFAAIRRTSWDCWHTAPAGCPSTTPTTFARASIAIESDLRNYYLLGYTPANDEFDGRFRNIEVKVKRPDVTIAWRRGYFAVRDPGGAPINAWEAPALGALEQKPVPNAFPVRAGAMLFPERGRPGLVPVVVELKTAPLTFQPAPTARHTRRTSPSWCASSTTRIASRARSASTTSSTAPSPRSTARRTATSSSTANRSSRRASTRWRPSSTTRCRASPAFASPPSKSRSTRRARCA